MTIDLSGFDRLQEEVNNAADRARSHFDATFSNLIIDAERTAQRAAEDYAEWKKWYHSNVEPKWRKRK